MKLKLIFICVLIPTLSFSQERWTYQSDSIYKVNKVKARKWYNGSTLVATSFYDRDGRMTRLRYEPFVGGEQRTTYFEYDEQGVLINQVDTTRNGKPDKATVKRLRKAGMYLSPKSKMQKPKIEVSPYKIDRENGEIVKLTKFNPEGTFDIIDRFENHRRKQIRDWYRDGQRYRSSVTEYVDDFFKKKYYGWEVSANSDRMEWDYTFEYRYEDGRVVEFTRFDNGEEKETTIMEYDNNGLLIRASYYTTERFEYEFYE